MYTLYHCQTAGARKKTHGPGCWILESRHPSENPIVRRVSEISAREILTTRCVDSLHVYLSASLYDGFMSQHASSGSQQ
jgi:hypothetical protein